MAGSETKTGAKPQARSLAPTARVSLFASLLLMAGVVATCVTCTPAVPPTEPAPVGYLIIPPDLVGLLDERHKASREEIVLCLLGQRAGYFVAVEGVDPPARIEATDTTVTFADCPQRRFVGVYHSHPGVSPRYCVPSALDMESMYADPRALVWLVSCGDGQFVAALRGYPRYQQFAREP